MCRVLSDAGAQARCTLERLWVADLTYGWTWARFCYVAFVVDAYSWRILGWRAATHLRADLTLDALEMAIFTRAPQDADLAGLVHHSDCAEPSV